MKSGGKSAEPDLPVLEGNNLGTAPMSSPKPLVPGVAGGNRNKIISPTSAEVLARKDTGRSHLTRMTSRRTLQFKSPVEGGVGEGSRLSVPRQVRRQSVAERRERSSRRQEESITSQSEDERTNTSISTVIRSGFRVQV